MSPFSLNRMLGLTATLKRHAQRGRLIALLKPMGIGKQKLATQHFLLARGMVPVLFSPTLQQPCAAGKGLMISLT